MRCGEALVCQPFEAELAGLKRVPARVKGQGMSDRTTRMKAHPAYRQLVRRRSRLAWTLTAIMLVAYFGYVLLIAFDKDFLGRPIGAGVTSLGIPVGFGIILLGVLLTAYYVHRANREFDVLLANVLAEEGE